MLDCGPLVRRVGGSAIGDVATGHSTIGRTIAAMIVSIMASTDDFRRIALSFAGVAERAHMGHPDFRVGGRIFATLHGVGKDSGAVMLLPEQQELAIEAEPEAFEPAAGAWGRGGSTVVNLGKVSDDWLERTLEWAWRKRAPV